MIRKTLIILVSFALLAVLVWLAAVRQEIRLAAQHPATVSGLRIWAWDREEAAQILQSFSPRAAGCKVVQGELPGRKKGGYLVVKDFRDIKKFNQTFKQVQNLNYSAQSLSGSDDRLRLQAGSAFFDEASARDFAAKLENLTGEEFQVLREQKTAAYPGFWVVLENLTPEQAEKFQAELKCRDRKFETVKTNHP